ncbi:hypothetical protein [Nocardioides flavescens]|uniref:Integral membrane protein n=1 Tax=Nocardioides flavescens TaxID=2691959 RepID=A0A6L7F284_9ACTN|nr:hypothetical protein [Nocardioides flavescens]MXG91705.1 hypothetical protein [Nocardioides flavescens]
MNRTSAPPPLLAAAAVVALEAAALVVLGVLELVHLSGGRVTLAVTTTAFFWLVGAGLGACAVALTRLSSWARGPVVAAELILVLTAFSTWGGSRQWALGMLAAAGVALVGVLHPASTAALAAEEDPADLR